MCDSVSIYCGQKVSADESLGSPKFDAVKEINFNMYFEYFDLLYSYSSLWLSFFQKIMSY